MTRLQPAAKKKNPFGFYRIVLPVLLGWLVIGIMFVKEFDPSNLPDYKFSAYTIAFIVLAFVFMLLRDVGMMWRFRLFTDNGITWKQAFHVNALSEFTSAVTPAFIGGSSLVVLFLMKEGINAGRSTAIMFINLFLDELFFIVTCPLLFSFVPAAELFPSGSLFLASFVYIFWGLYIVRLVWTSVLFIGIFRQPQWIKNMLLFLFRLPLLRRWYNNVETLTEHLVQASADFRHRPFSFWIKAFGMTLLTWSSRFLVVNAVFMALVPVSDHLVLYARQVILWVLTVVTPTPGGSGITEFAFREYYNDVISSESMLLIVTLIWRSVSYYLYLLLGALIVPRWINKSFPKNGSI